MTDKNVTETLKEISESIAEFKAQSDKNTAELLGVLADMKIKVAKITLTGIEISFGSGGKDHEK